MNLYFFLGLLEITLIAIIVAVVQAVYLKKYRPYYMANTRPELFLRKYLQRLIAQTKRFAKQFHKGAKEGDNSSIKKTQRMTARLNWLVLERDFAITAHPDTAYWDDINVRIEDMLKNWKEVEYIKEPPDIEIINLALDDNPEDFDFENANLDVDVQEQIAQLKKKAKAASSYKKMYQEMEMAYKTQEDSYVELKKYVNELKLEAQEAENLRKIIAQQDANQQSINAMMAEIEQSKERLNQELHQLEEAYEALEGEVGNSDILRNSANPNANELLEVLHVQQKVLSDLKRTLKGLKMKPTQAQKVEDHTNKIERANREIGHNMQMLELERERLEQEVKMFQEA